MDDNRLEVPYIVYEGEQARHERTIKRLIIALVIAVIVTLLSNVAWLIYLSGYEFYGSDSEVMVEAKDGIANFIGQNGDIINGEEIRGLMASAPDERTKKELERLTRRLESM